ncbi:MAG: hypothetical protein LBI17_01870 [Rickettsiales bacterium]|jgi:hypothetical protein|nr:hypothetical protein [Rickettsiales bacterium]
MGLGNVQTKANTFTEQVVVDNVCPFGKIVQKLVADEGDSDYYTSKTKTCNRPNNVKEIAWTKEAYPALEVPTWMQTAEATIFECDNGYVLGKANKVAACINAAVYCPLGEVLATARDESNKVKVVDGLPTLKNPKTDMVCLPPEKSKLRNIAGSSTMFLIECPEGQYSGSVANSGRGDHITCNACPEGKTSLKGSIVMDDCYKICDAGTMVDPANGNECLTCDANSTYSASKKICECNAGYYGTGTPGTCLPCPVGSYCKGGRMIEACDPSLMEYQNKESQASCTRCPAYSIGLNGTTCSCLKQGKRFDNATNECV